MPIKFAAKLNSFSRGPRGFFVKLEIAPDDDWENLAKAPLGTSFGVAMVEIDAETGKTKDASPGNASPRDDAGQQRGEAGKPRRPFHELPRAQQAGIMANDHGFQLWLSEAYPNTAIMDDCAAAIRELCGVYSRADLATDRQAAKKWDQLVTDFYQASGRMAEVRG